MHLETLQPPAAEPVDLAALRLHLKVDADDEDATIAACLAAARDSCEDNTGRQLVAAKLRCVLGAFPSGEPYRPVIRLPKAPLIEFVGITYLDAAGVEQTLPPTDYVVCGSAPVVVAPAPGKCWPCAADQPGAVKIDFWAGYCAPFGAASIDNTIAVDGYPALSAGAVVRLSNSGGELPKPLRPRAYYIKTVVSEGVYTLSETLGGDAINLTTNGSGTHFLGPLGNGSIPAALNAWLLLRAETHYTMRGEHLIVKGGSIEKLPVADRLLDAHRVPGL